MCPSSEAHTFILYSPMRFLQTFMYIPLCRWVLSFLLGKYPGVLLLGYVGVCLPYNKMPTVFQISSNILHFISHESSSCSIHVLRYGIVLHLNFSNIIRYIDLSGYDFFCISLKNNEVKQHFSA